MYLVYVINTPYSKITNDCSSLISVFRVYLMLAYTIGPTFICGCNFCNNPVIHRLCYIPIDLIIQLF